MSMSGAVVDQGEKNRKLLHDLQKTKQQMMMKGVSAVSRAGQPPLAPSSSMCSTSSPQQSAALDGLFSANSLQGTAGGAQQLGTLTNKSTALFATSMEMIQKSSINFYPTNSNYGNQLLPGFPRFLAD